jgi:hypothetical protein
MDENRTLTGGAAAGNGPRLLPDETLRWEGRPAPRCYTFRRWRQALLGLLLTLFCLIWWWLAAVQAGKTGMTWLAWVPLPFLGYALWLGAGELLAARLEWRNVAYAITDRRLIVRRGLLRPVEEALPLERLTWFRLQPHAEELGSLQIRGAAGDPLLELHCIEYPRRPAELLEAVIKANQLH